MHLVSSCVFLQSENLRFTFVFISDYPMLVYFSHFIWATYLYHLSLPRMRLTSLGWQGRDLSKIGKQFLYRQGSILLFCAGR